MEAKIFVSIASYQDPLLFFTLNDAVNKAERPELLRFGVADQSTLDQKSAIDQLPFRSQLRYVHINPRDTLGVSWARNIAFSLYDSEEYFLQIDSHTCFEQNWDRILRVQHRRLLERSEKPILSTYPYPFQMIDSQPQFDIPKSKTVLVLRPCPDVELKENDLVVRFHARHMFTTRPVAGCHIAAGFIFCAGSFIEEVPYDPYLYFHGEEQSLTIRAYTRGWDTFHPPRIPLYHFYKPSGTEFSTHHWHGDIDRERAFDSAYLIERSKNRLSKLLSGSLQSGSYGLGQQRSLDDFIKFSGIDYKTRTITNPYQDLLF